VERALYHALRSAEAQSKRAVRAQAKRGILMTDYQAQLAQMTKMLKSLDAWLDKAVAHAEAEGSDPAKLLEARLAPDMYSLSRQIQAVCDGVKFLAARTAGKDAPKHRDGDDLTFAELRARIHDVLAFAATFGAKDFEGADQRIVPLGFMPGKGLYAASFVIEMNVPNTYFHLCMAYAILRQNGVKLGKMDFIGGVSLQDI
jgi:uncharacterized protein